MALLYAGSILLGIGVFTLGGAIVMEIKHKDPIWMLAVKIATVIFAIGAAIFTSGCAMYLGK